MALKRGGYMIAKEDVYKAYDNASYEFLLIEAWLEEHCNTIQFRSELYEEFTNKAKILLEDKYNNKFPLPTFITLNYEDLISLKQLKNISKEDFDLYIAFL